MENGFAEVSLSIDGNEDCDNANIFCELHAEEVTLPTLYVGSVRSDDQLDSEDNLGEDGEDYCLPNDKIFTGTSPAKCFIGCEALVLIPCTPCCIYVPALRGGVGCVQFTSRITVLAPVIIIMAVLLCPLTCVTAIHDSFSNDENKCIPVDSRAELVLLSCLLCAPYNQRVLDDNYWPKVNRDERDFFGKVVSQVIVEHFH